MLRHFPDGLDTLQEQVNGGAFGHLARALQVLVHSPELIDSIKIRECLNVLLVPPVTFILSIHCVCIVEPSFVKLPISKTQMLILARNLNLDYLLEGLLGRHGSFNRSNSWVNVNHF